MNAVLKNIAFAVITAGLALALLEAGLRLLGPPPSVAPEEMPAELPGHFKIDPVMGWRPNPGQPFIDPGYANWMAQFGVDISELDAEPTNSQGYRDSELAKPRPVDQVRVYAMGDSSVMGAGAPRQMTYAQRLERALASPWSDDPASRSVEVINAGVAGYSSLQSLALLEGDLAVGLDAVICYSMNSDLMTTHGATDSELFGGVLSSPGARGGAAALAPLKNAYLSRWLAWGLQKRPSRSRGPRSRVSLSDYGANLRRLIDMGQRNGFEVIFVLPPTPGDLIYPQPRETYIVDSETAERRIAAMLVGEARRASGVYTRETLRAVMALEAWRGGAPIIDGPTTVLEAYLGDREAFAGQRGLFVDEIHPSVEGHRVLAEAILPVLKPIVEDKRLQRLAAALGAPQR